MSCSRESHPGPTPKSPRAVWKLIVAADAPWRGEIYHTRPGHQRLPFSSVETFCSALLAVTGWPLKMSTPEAVDTPAASNQVTRNRFGSKLRHEIQTGKGKFIVAADAAWTGEIYRTRPGLGRVHFMTFEEFLRAVLGVTGWQLEQRTPQRTYASAVTGVSRPV